MNIKVGDQVKFIGCTKEQITWGNNDDPNLSLCLDNLYYVGRVEIHSQHTKLELNGIKGKYNSVCFEKVEVTDFGNV
jgi:hypothetical protein